MSYEASKEICYKNQGAVCGDCPVHYAPEGTPQQITYHANISYQPSQREIRDMILYDKVEGGDYDPGFQRTKAMIKGQQPSTYITATERDDTGITFKQEEVVEPEVQDKDRMEIQEEIERLQKSHVKEAERERIMIMMRERIERQVFVKREVKRRKATDETYERR